MFPNLQAIVGHALQDDQDHVFDVETLCCLPPEDGALQGLSNGGQAKELPPSTASQHRRHCSARAGYTSCSSCTTRGVCSPARWSCSTQPAAPGSWTSPPQLHHSQFMLTQVRISHRMLSEQIKDLMRSQSKKTRSSSWKDSQTISGLTFKKSLRSNQSDKKTFEVFIWHYHTNDLINRESFPKLFDVATPMSRKDGCASVAGVDVANPCVNSSYFQFVMKQM